MTHLCSSKGPISARFFLRHAPCLPAGGSSWMPAARRTRCSGPASGRSRTRWSSCSTATTGSCRPMRRAPSTAARWGVAQPGFPLRPADQQRCDNQTDGVQVTACAVRAGITNSCARRSRPHTLAACHSCVFVSHGVLFWRQHPAAKGTGQVVWCRWHCWRSKKSPCERVVASGRLLRVLRIRLHPHGQVPAAACRQLYPITCTDVAWRASKRRYKVFACLQLPLCSR